MIFQEVPSDRAQLGLDDVLKPLSNVIEDLAKSMTEDNKREADSVREKKNNDEL